MKKFSLVLLALATALAITPTALANTIAWTNWSSGTAGAPGSATGTIVNMGVDVTYTGQTSGLGIGYGTSIGTFYPGQNSGTGTWGLTSSYTGGIVGNAPPTSYNSVALQGGPPPLLETIHFSSPVVNPLIAIWSLGQNGRPAEFQFEHPFSVISGGPSSEYGGSGLLLFGVPSLNAFGVEGNGIIQFAGVFTDINFYTPLNENWYSFTVGEQTPEPSSLLLLGTGLLALALLLFRKVKSSGLVAQF